MAEVIGVLIGIIVLTGLFGLGLAIFRRKIEIAASSRPSPSFERVFPKLIGGFFMLGAAYGLILIALGSLGVFHKS